MRRLFLSILAVVLVFCYRAPLNAQIGNATVSGRVLDASGGAVPDAKVNITDVDTAFVYTGQAGADGGYVISNIKPGHYRIEVSKAGFRTEIMSDVVLNVQDTVTLNFNLAVGSVSESVTVSAEVPLVNTSNSSIGGLVDEQKIVDLPLNGRNYTDLVFLQPGIAKSNTQSSVSAPGGTIYSSNGAPTRSNNYLLDGAQMQSLQGYSSSSVAATNLGVDGIQEYKTLTSNFSAEYGMTMGSQMTLVSKSGTNQFHGDAFEFLRNAAMDSRNFFDYTYQTTGKRDPQYQRNNFGGAFGGPIKKDKLFIFGVYEGLRQNQGVPFIENTLGPGCHGTGGQAIWNGVGTAPAGSVGNCPQLGGTAASTTTISSAMAPFIALYPLPNLNRTCGATSGCTFFFNFVQPTTVNYGQARGDYVLSSKDSFFTRYTTEQATLATGSAAGPTTVNLLSSWNQWSTISENHVFSTSLLNTARFSYSRTTQGAGFTSPSGQNISFAPLGGSGLAGSYGMSNAGTTGLTGLGATGLAPASYAQNLYSLSDDVLYTWGKHAFKFGMLINRVEPSFNEVWYSRGNATFGSIPAFFTGTIQSITIQNTNSIDYRYYQWYTIGQYAQDDWRLSSRLTLNLGLRYEVNTNLTERNGHQYSLRNPYTDATPTQGPEIRNASLKNFGPRLGFAWDIFGNGTTSLRGGGGIYYDVENVASALTQQSTAMPPLSAIYIINNIQAATPLTIPAGTKNNPVEMYYNSNQPFLVQWNLSVDQKLPFGMVANVSYVGTRGHHLFVQTEGNPILPVATSSNGLPIFGCWNTADTSYALPGTGACPANSATAGPNGGPRVNPNWGSNTLDGSFSRSWYDGLQFVVNKKLSNNLELQSSFAWEKNLDYGQGEIQQDHTGVSTYFADPAIDKGPATFNLAKTYRLNILYHLPNTKSSSSFVSELANGWWTGIIFSAQTGFPFSPLTSGSRSLSNVNGNNADRTNLGPTYDPNTVITGNPNQWYNPSMFALQPQGLLGNAGRDILTGPGLMDLDLAINKDTKVSFLGEAGTFEFRAEFFNIMNHANFSVPNAGATVFTSSGGISGTAGQITTTVALNRDIQLALKLIF